MKCDLLDILTGEKVSLSLDKEIFTTPYKDSVLSSVIRWQLAGRRSGTHSVKVSSDVNRTGKKFVRQKGTGGARHSSRKVCIFRGGGVVFGPTVRSHAFALPKKVRRLGLRMALSLKLAEQKILLIKDTENFPKKTKEASHLFMQRAITSGLIVDQNTTFQSIRKAVSNISSAIVLPDVGLNVYDIIKHDFLIFTKPALEKLQGRLK
jgi:large subunit ribosomal protein L4